MFHRVFTLLSMTFTYLSIIMCVVIVACFFLSFPDHLLVSVKLLVGRFPVVCFYSIISSCFPVVVGGCRYCVASFFVMVLTAFCI
jgi:hypothetical protein